MTLALYGKVERAPRGTEGTINQAEKLLTVSFTFELGQNPRQRYRVERTYRRKDNAAHCTKAKMLEITAGQENILEEGGPKVTARVESVLGLKDKDFTRAVVLPQGKFAEFLSLRGSERCKMLERIFNLQEYGNELIERVKARNAEMASKLRDLDMEQQGLGDASAEALAACP